MSAKAVLVALGAAALAPVLLQPAGSRSGSWRLPDVVRPDGSAIEAHLDRRGADGPQGIILIAQGSGCGSAEGNPNIRRAKALLLPSFAVLTVEDYGVKAGDADLLQEGRCPPAFYAHHTISQRAADARQVLALLEASPWWNGQLVVFGGSEGGAVAQELAPVVPAQAVVVYASAMGDRFRDALATSLPPSAAAKLRDALQEVERRPASSRIFAGNSYRWWADIMNRRLSDDLLRAQEPILVVQGARDGSNPVASARTVRDAFRAAGKRNLTYLEFAGFDHHMIGQDGVDHFDEVIGRVDAWVRAQLTSPRPAVGRAPSSMFSSKPK